MEPVIRFGCGLHGQHIVFPVVFAHQNFKPAASSVSVRIRSVFFLFCRFFFPAATQKTRIFKFGTYSFDFIDIVGVFQKSQHRLKVVYILFVDFELNVFFSDGSLGFSEVFKIQLSIFIRRVPWVERYRNIFIIVVIGHGDRLRAAFDQVHVCGKKFAEQPQLLGIAGIQQILFQPLLFKIEFVQFGVKMFCQFTRLLPYSVRRFSVSEVPKESFTQRGKSFFCAGTLKSLQVRYVEFSRNPSLICICAGDKFVFGYIVEHARKTNTSAFGVEQLLRKSG